VRENESEEEYEDECCSLLFRGSAGDDSGNVVENDHGLVHFHACERGEVDRALADGFDLAGDRLAGFEAELDALADEALQDRGDSFAGLRGETAVGSDERSGEYGEKSEDAERFHDKGII
jgi:hypothetical protein